MSNNKKKLISKEESNEKQFLRNCYIAYLDNKDKASKNFDALFYFYRAFYITPNFKIKIMITRRSYVLFKIFEEVFKAEKYNSSGEFFTSNFISQISSMSNISEKNLLLIDDIVINGRTMLQAYMKLSNLLNIDEENIELHAFLINKEAKCLEDIQNRFIDYAKEVKVSESYWRSISDELNLFIAVTNIGYTSYIDTIKLPSPEIINELIAKKAGYTEQTNLLFKKIGLKSYIKELTAEDFKGKQSFFSLLKNLDIFPCIRIYVRTTDISDENNRRGVIPAIFNRVTVIPFAYLPSIKTSKFVMYANKILDYLKEFTTIDDDKANKIIDICNRIDNNNYKNIESGKDDDLIYLYEWLSFVLSKLIGKVWEDEYSSIDNNTLILDGINYGISCHETFNETYLQDQDIDFYNKNIKIDNSQSFKTCKTDVSIGRNIINNSAELECVSKFRDIKEELEINNSEQSSLEILKHILPVYLSEVRKLDEMRATYHEDRLKGLRADDIYFIFNDQNNINIKKELIMELMINSWDCGDGSGAPKIFGSDDKKNISTSIINGEQIYRYIFDSNPQETFDFKLFYNNSIMNDYYALERFANYMDELSGKKTYINFLRYFKENIKDFVAGINSDYVIDKNNKSLNRNINKVLKYVGVF